MSKSLETLLHEELGRVRAPAELWDRAQLPRHPRPAVRLRLAWAAALLVMSALGLHAFLKSEAVRSPGLVRFQAACHLCHGGDDLQSVMLRGVY
jgi:mono/diheme cytochrome c family protein